MTARTLIIRVPLTDSDPENIIQEIEAGDLDPTDLVIEREDDVSFTLEVS